ncbi:PAS-domain containing protein [Rhodoplanes sp. TEM]|uniref:histidine kinase n=1 Tax=Rhodoplanes tepidamans TaxID=200616 RepID=A0ABT5J9Z5_RHOTP|nr:MULTISPECIES: NahK/ErcS family hybrid sensor histidine kinase/response regulator [Rhodoplanes]MDC7786383.1 PAS-domain containing protein [Rhodoplanes tepidamans]MDC7985455.1 PAS-domain containing protein [Rhodoplanes sp. TEM]MDQ0354127.1 Na+/proline symporter/signal transduction histidine kinase/CheY-like chemotaxis protein [Rhodoplanes tepidamans]
MPHGWVAVGVALGYIGMLFLVASWGDRIRASERRRRSRLIYPLSLAIYCTSWTFFGSVGLASRSGFDFLAIYVGPILVIGLASPLVTRIVRLAKGQNITSIADFIAARHGKNQAVAAIVAVIAIAGTIPYIALQLKAVSSSLGTILAEVDPESWSAHVVLGDIGLVVAVSMALFAILFGTRHIDATEHQDGLILAVATESLVKLVAFLAVGVFVTYGMFGGPASLFVRALERPEVARVLTGEQSFSTFAAMTLLAAFAILLLPRQFHVAVVENNSEAEVRRAAWLFPIYLVLINLFVVPIALAGLLTFPNGTVDGDMYVLALPLAAGSQTLALVAFVGGLSAATAMVIVESVALAIMVSNDLFVPLVLRRRGSLGSANAGALLLRVRRFAILGILLLAWLYHRSAGPAQLASIGLLSFAAISQLAPAFFGGLFWRRATARGAVAGMVVGFSAWTWTLLLPSFVDAGMIDRSLLTHGPFGLALLRPEALLGLDLPPLVHGVVVSLALNLFAYVTVSLRRAPSAIERLQADIFVPSRLTPTTPSFRLWRSAVTVGELTATVARYLGEERTRTAFEAFAVSRRITLDPKHEADFQLLQHAEHLLASAIGAASSRLVLSLLLRKRLMSTKAALKLLDDANAAIHYNREILQTALDHVRQGIAVFSKELALVCWNRQFGELLDLPPALVRVGATLDDVLRFNAAKGAFGPGEVDLLVRERAARYATSAEPFLERFPARGLIIEVRVNQMPGGGFVLTFTDITPSVEAAEALERANDELERRVRERTAELERLNAELADAKAAAENANLSKTRFLAAASHDILQPLNAARLYVTSLVERQSGGEEARLAGHVDASLEAVEEILGALLDISRLDTGVLKTEITTFGVDELFRQLEVEFAPLAREKNLALAFVHSRLVVRSDRRLLRRLVRNLVSNAIKYTEHGRVLVGCRRCGKDVRIDVYDTGIGIATASQRAIFEEFHRLERGALVARGLGLGLSIVERIARVLDHTVALTSEVGRGSHFSVTLPRAAVATPEPGEPPALRPHGHLAGSVALCIDNEPAILDGMETLLTGWGCEVLKAPDLDRAVAAVERTGRRPTVLLVDYHLDVGNGIDTIVALRRRYGESLPAILLTADRTREVRDTARERDIRILNKPVRPAPLRAQLTQWQALRVAAAE